MPFQQRKLDRSVLQSRGIFNKYIYAPDNGDTIADITAANYFADARFASIDGENTNGMGWVGGIMEVMASDGYFVGEIGSDGESLNQIGGATDPVFTTLTEGEVPRANASGQLVYAGATVDPATNIWSFDERIVVPADSLDFGEILRLAEGANRLFTQDFILDQRTVSVYSVVDETTGSSTPVYPSMGATFQAPEQPIDTDQITTNPLIFPFTSVAPQDVRWTYAFNIRTFAAMTNVRLLLTDNATGRVIKYLPSESDWNNGTGVDLILGDNKIDFVSTDPDSPGVINLGGNPIEEQAGQVLDFEIRADNMALLGVDLGGGVEIPYNEPDVQDGNLVPIGTGGGDVSGPGSSLVGNLAPWADINGTSLSAIANSQLTQSASEIALSLQSPSVTGTATFQLLDSLGAQQFEWDLDETNSNIELIANGYNMSLANTSGAIEFLTTSGDFTTDIGGNISFVTDNTLYMEGNTATLTAENANMVLICNSIPGAGYFIMHALNREATDPFMEWSNAFGTDGSAFNWHVTDSDPDGNITSDPGAVIVRSDGVNSNIYLHLDAAASNDNYQSIRGNIVGPESNTANALAGFTGTDGTIEQITELNHSTVSDDFSFNVDIPSAGGTASINLRDESGVAHYDLVYDDATNASSLVTLGNWTTSSGGSTSISAGGASTLTAAGTNSIISTGGDVTLISNIGDIFLQTQFRYIESGSSALIDIGTPIATGACGIEFRDSTNSLAGALLFNDSTNELLLIGDQSGGIEINAQNGSLELESGDGDISMFSGSISFGLTAGIATINLQVPATDGIVEYGIADSTGSEVMYWRFNEASSTIELDAPNNDININSGTDEVLRLQDDAFRMNNSSLDAYFDVYIPANTGEGGVRVYDENDALVFSLNHDDNLNECNIESLSSGDQLTISAVDQPIRIETNSPGSAPPVLELGNTTEVMGFFVYNDDPNGNISSDSDIAFRIEDSVDNSIYMAKTANSFAEVQWAQQKMIIQESNSVTLTREKTLILAENTGNATYTPPTPANTAEGIGWTQNILKLSGASNHLTINNINQGDFTGPFVLAKPGDSMTFVQDGTATHLFSTNRLVFATIQRLFGDGETTIVGNTGANIQLDVFTTNLDTYQGLCVADQLNGDIDFPTIENTTDGDLYEVELEVSMRGTEDDTINFVVQINDNGSVSYSAPFIEHVFTDLAQLVTVTGKIQLSTGTTGGNAHFAPYFTLPTGAQAIFSLAKFTARKIERRS